MIERRPLFSPPIPSFVRFYVQYHASLPISVQLVCGLSASLRILCHSLPTQRPRPSVPFLLAHDDSFAHRVGRQQSIRTSSSLAFLCFLHVRPSIGIPDPYISSLRPKSPIEFPPIDQTDRPRVEIGQDAGLRRFLLVQRLCCR